VSGVLLRLPANRLPLTAHRSTFCPVPDTFRTPNILVVRFSSIGDILLTTPLLRAIRRRHRDARMTVLTKQAYVPLLSDNPHVDRIIALGPGRSLRSLAAEVRAGSFTHRLDLHGSLRSRALRVMAPGRWTSHPKHRIARALLIQTKRNRYRDRRPVPERYFDAARDLDVSPDGAPPEFFLGSDAEGEADHWLATSGLATDRPLIAVAPGAAHATKRWPLEHWRALVSQITSGGSSVAIVGGPGDSRLGTALAGSGQAQVASAAGVFGLQTTGALLRRSAAVVSGDTGVMHMATGVGTPVVALYGPTVEPFGFFPYARHATVLEVALSCRPCSSQGGPRCPLGHHRCMLELRPDLVYDSVRRCIA
jgi:lipopolysaccharide heptosyltransferase II